MGPKKDKTTFTEKDLKEWNKNQYGNDDEQNIPRAEHQARNDYQRAGEPFGSLENRNISEKSDTTSVEVENSKSTPEDSSK